MNLFTYLGAAVGLLILLVMAALPIVLTLSDRLREPAAEDRRPQPLAVVHSS